MRNLTYSLLLGATLLSATALAEMDVDQADSLNFEGFHTDKKEAVKIWKEKEEDKAVKTYEQQPAQTTIRSETLGTPAATTVSPAQTASAATATATGDAGKRFEIRERYSLGRSTQTPYSAFYVIEALHRQSAQLCPRGWKKLSEKSEPVEEDFFLYYELECL